MSAFARLSIIALMQRDVRLAAHPQKRVPWSRFLGLMPGANDNGHEQPADETTEADAAVDPIAGSNTE